jgi:hypothetical protein
MKSLKDLVESLRRASEAPVKIDDSVKAIDVSPEAPSGYVWPDLREWSGESGARVVLIEAAGAVGKSAAAAALAAELNWPLVDSSKAQVGSYSLSGLVHDALGFESNFLGDVSAGRAGIIVDALDEAHLRAFLENVRRLGAGGDAMSNIILFSRPDTADLIREFFRGVFTPLSTATIEFLDHVQACQFIGAYMEKMYLRTGDKRYAVAGKHPQAFGDLRDRRFCEVASALLTKDVPAVSSCWEQVRAFLGYAPVLLVLGEYLAVSNPSAEQSVQMGHSGPSEILLKIISHLLEREHEKFKKQVVSKLYADVAVAEEWEDSGSVYSPGEQGLRLVARNLHLELIIPPPVNLPLSIRTQYERHADQFIADHPFLAGRDAVNVVFGDFLQAKAAVDLDCSAALRPDSRKRVTSVGPFFYQFVHEFATRSEVDVPQIDEALVPLIIDSYAQSTSFSSHIFGYFQSGGEAQLILADIPSGVRTVERTYEVVELSGLLEFPDRLSRGFVFTDAAVRLGGNSERFVLGPTVQLACQELIIASASISVDPGVIDRRTIPSIIRADSIQALTGLSVDCQKSGALKVVGSHGISALIPFQIDRIDGIEYADYKDYVDLRAVLRFFKQGVGPAPSVYYEKLEQGVVKDNSTRRLFLAGLIALRVVYRQRNHYYLNLGELAKYGVSFGEIAGGELTKSTARLIMRLKAKPV